MSTKLKNTDRIAGFDFARALAILGMIIVNYKIALNATGKGPDWLVLFSNAFDGRAVATFVTLAGVGISLMTFKARHANTHEMINKERIHLCKRALFLLVLGLVFYLVWPADILHYYGFYMLIAAFLFNIPSKNLWYIAIAINITYTALFFTFNYGTGWTDGFVYVDFWTLRGFFRNLFFNGFHPILPWITFILIGLWLGRQNLQEKTVRKRILKGSMTILIAVELLSWALVKLVENLLTDGSLVYFFLTQPLPPNVFYIAAASSLAVSIICISVYIAEKLKNSTIVKWLIKTGQMALSHYLGHVLVGLGLLEVLGYLENQTLIFSIVYSVLIFLMMILFSNQWSKRVGRGPLESIMRKLTD